MQLVKYHAVSVKAVLVAHIGREHLVDTARWLINEPLLGIQYLDPLGECRTHSHHVGRHIEHNGRLHILGKLTECIAEPRADYKPFVPRIVQITIPQDMIGAVIGPGGKVIQDIQKTTGTTITITEVDNKGIVDIFGQDKTALDGALNRIKAIVAIPEVGETYHGKIRSIVTFGAFVEIMPGKDALLHISEIDYKRFETMEETGLKEGDEIDVKLIGIDPKTNKLKLSRKVLLPKPEGYEERERRPREDRPDRGESRERRDRPGRKEE